MTRAACVVAVRRAPCVVAVRRAACVVVALLVWACQTGGPPASTRFEALEGGRFRYTAPADAARPVADSQAEHARRRWLEQHLAAQKLCPNGYRIDSRVALDQNTGFVRQVGVGTYDVVYEGRCTG
jgi:hypothetical protein